jgi:hypothetical protein
MQREGHAILSMGVRVGKTGAERIQSVAPGGTCAGWERGRNVRRLLHEEPPTRDEARQLLQEDPATHLEMLFEGQKNEGGFWSVLQQDVRQQADQGP